MGRRLKRRLTGSLFKFQPFSKKQLKVLTWWLPTAPVKDSDGIIADGAIRSGKTLSMSLSFIVWAMQSFRDQNFAMCGKTILSFRRNVVILLKIMLRSRGYTVQDHRTDNLLTVRRGDAENYFYLFGGKDERSQDLIQGITLAGVFFDEVALMPESFVNQATGRCSVAGSKYWFNCNPDGPAHWFKKGWINAHEAKNLVYLHFTMDDNLSLSEAIKARYRSNYTGVFYRRYILGEWAVAEGRIYTAFDKEKHVWNQAQLAAHLERNPISHLAIGVDFGGSGSASVFTLVGFTRNFRKAIALAEYFDSDNLSAEHLLEAWKQYAALWKEQYPRLADAWLDHEMLFVKSFRQAMPQINVAPARKSEISSRIVATDMMLAQEKLVVMEACPHLIEAFDSAVWDQRRPNELIRLDDGTVNIDSLDSFEYATERHYRDILRV